MTAPPSLRLELELTPREISTSEQLTALADLAHETRKGVVKLLTVMAEMEAALRILAEKEKTKS